MSNQEHEDYLNLLPPSVKRFAISNFSEFVTIIQNDLACGHWFYRGLKSKAYELKPTLARLKNMPDEPYEYEMTMLRKTFAGLVDHDVSSSSEINKLLLAQHHGSPTRLLDWTSSALVAAYFASESDDRNDDFKIVAAHICPLLEGNTHFSAHDLKNVDFYDGYCLTHKNVSLSIEERPNLREELAKRGTIFVQGSDISPRVSAQQGYISIQNDIHKPLDTQPSEDITKVVHIEVKASARTEFQDTLYQLGIRRRSLFPDVDAVFGEYAKEQEIHERLCDRCMA